jgi:hypothetical protein
MVGREKSGWGELVSGDRLGGGKVFYVVEVEGIHQVRHMCSSSIRDLLCTPD